MHYPGHLRDRFIDWVDEGMPDVATVEIDYEVMEEPARDFAMRFLGCTDLMPRIERETVEDILELRYEEVEGDDEALKLSRTGEYEKLLETEQLLDYGGDWDGTYHAAAFHWLVRNAGMTPEVLTDEALRRIGLRRQPKPRTDDAIRVAIDTVNRNPRAWLTQADALKRAADLIGVRFQGEAGAWLKTAEMADGDDADERAAIFALGHVYLMNAGFAIENLVKGLIVAQGASEERLQQVTTTHDLAALLVDAEVQLTDGDPDLVNRLTHHLKWGRYPAPSMGDARAYERSVNVLGEFWGSPMRVSTGDVAAVDDFFARMRAALDEATVRET